MSPREGGSGRGRAGFLTAALFLVPLASVSGRAAGQDPGAGPPGDPAVQETPGEALPVVERELANGMRFLVLPREGAPTVSFVVQYRTGSVDEVPGSTGIAHLLEHLLFKGTTTVGTRDPESERDLFRRMDPLQDTILALRAAARHLHADTADVARRIRALRDSIRVLEDSARAFTVPNEFHEILTRNGARGLNATTTSESTSYYVELPANRTRLWFVLEADRMRNPVFREFYAERDVVLEERRTRVEDDPGGRLYLTHLGAAYRVHPYRIPVIGYASDVANLTRRRVREHYRRYYGPENAVVAVVGDVDPGRIVEWAEAYFGPIPRGEASPPVLVEEPPQRGERRVEVVFDAEPAVRIGWHVPDGFHRDMPALVVLSNLLAGGRTSRLHRRLVRDERLATFVTASLGPGVRFPELFTVHAQPRHPHAPAELEAAIYEELGRLAETPPTGRELLRVRNQIEAGSVRRLRSNLGLAFQLAESATAYGDWRATFRFFSALQAVTPEDVQRVARTYFGKENRTVATLTRDGGEAP